MDTNHDPSVPGSLGDFARKTLTAGLIVALLVALWQISPVIVLAFGGVVVAVVLRTMSAPVARLFRLSDYISLLLVTVGLVAVAIAFFAVFGALAVSQFNALLEQIPGAIAAGRKWLTHYTEGRWFLALLGKTEGPTGETLLQALPLAGGVLGGLGEALLILMIGIYLAADPATYMRGLARLFAPPRRVRVLHVMNDIAQALQRWLMGMALDMLFVGVVTGIGLWIVGMPFPLALAFLTGISVFVPYIGPAIVTVIGVLIGLSMTPTLAFYAFIVYAVVFTIEGNVTQPLLQRWAVSLSPVMNLLAIVAFGIVFGLWGAILATPMAVALSVLVRKVYVEDMLEGHRAQAG